ncbi:hypothetical protein Hanom_Chr09g00820751 [Helianthus anomalus]
MIGSISSSLGLFQLGVGGDAVEKLQVESWVVGREKGEGQVF